MIEFNFELSKVKLEKLICLKAQGYSPEKITNDMAVLVGNCFYNELTRQIYSALF